ncbi:DNA-3-methyladenine glycosylase family protein [Bacilliculturomica massiliensis]|uniref:DNA-3-methyladenine glycosylase family protein n=1 Tax=Bacilliculturomica massiliensis TaxID=1917867 RepID=UPI00102F6889|nr:DNA glycosylase [Bacilliculturomica massiliensis]
MSEKRTDLRLGPIVIEHMDLAQIADSGQCFTWTRLDEGCYAIQALGRCLVAVQEGDRFFFSCSEDEFRQVWSHYFDLERDYGQLKRRIDPEDAYLRAAVEYGGGIRVLKQDLWEVMVSFLISQNNNIGRIRNSIRGLCGEYGRKMPMDGGRFYYAFPRPEELAAAGEADFIRLGLGYRAKYLKALTEDMKDGGLAQLKGELDGADDETAGERLMSIYGIGKKVADCICLFGLHRTGVFPVDTHIKKIIAGNYAGNFPYERYGSELGIVQQYLFYYHLKGSAY